MNKNEFLRSLTTPQLVIWRDRADALGGIYTNFDTSTNSTSNFTLESISVELNSRDDNPNKIAKKKKK